MTTHLVRPLLACLLLAGTFDSQAAWKPAKGFFVPDATKSPDGKYGVLVPDEDHVKEGAQQNQVVELATGKVLGTIEADTYAVWKDGGGVNSMTGYGLGAAWSADGDVLSWNVGGEWFPSAWVLIKVENSAIAWQVDVLKKAQDIMLETTRATVPENYAAVKMNKDNGSAYPDGFTIIPSTPEGGFTLPWRFVCTIDSNPKGIERLPAKGNVGAAADLELAANGDVTLQSFQIEHDLTGVARAEGATASELRSPMAVKEEQGGGAFEKPAESAPDAAPKADGKAFNVPKENPLVTCVFPKPWSVDYDESNISIEASLGEDVVIYVQPIDATDVVGQTTEARKEISKLGVKFRKQVSDEGSESINGMDVASQTWQGKYGEGDAEVRMYVFSLPATDPDKAVDSSILVTVWGAPEDLEKFKSAIDKVLHQMKPRAAG